jgi:CRP-like cAMP-binding protein
MAQESTIRTYKFGLRSGCSGGRLRAVNSASPERNRLLMALPPEWQAQHARDLEAVVLTAQQVLAFPDEPIEHVHFPRTAVVSLLVPMEDGTAIEGATVGNEGMLGLQVFLGEGTAREEIVVQIAGDAARMRVSDFRQAVATSAGVRRTLSNYTLALMNQFARTAGCNRLHSVTERCIRWLLMSRDRAGTETFPLTHESLAALLGVRRASVTQAAGSLQRAGLIEYHHGTIRILDGLGLEAAACEDYRLSREAYDRIYL